MSTAPVPRREITRPLMLVLACAIVAPLVLSAAPPAPFEQAGGGLVGVTPLGSHAGEFCRNDRAVLFEDPTGVRILYDPGRTVDEGDPRLGEVHLMLLSHAHTDHIGDVRPNRASPGTCAAPASGGANANSNFVTIAAAKNAAVFVAGELPDFLARKIQAVRGSATPGCITAGLDNETVVPLSAPCTASLRAGGSRAVKRIGASGSVRVAVVPAVHSNGIAAQFLEAPGPLPGTTGYGGGESGFVLQFSTGLSVHMTGDSGMFGDMASIIERYYVPKLVIINMGDVATMGPDEAAFAITHLVRPTTVMPFHANEQSTSGGVVQAGTRVQWFADRVRPYAGVVLPLSGITFQFDQDGRCVGCR
ncbi:MAG: MBL fold metallo-hydrolase [Acidobacteria bacterium]|nr:MBL fold metallo-hydrolase [Acidobacteriota bacterium]